MRAEGPVRIWWDSRKSRSSGRLLVVFLWKRKLRSGSASGSGQGPMCYREFLSIFMILQQCIYLPVGSSLENWVRNPYRCTGCYILYKSIVHWVHCPCYLIYSAIVLWDLQSTSLSACKQKSGGLVGNEWEFFGRFECPLTLSQNLFSPFAKLIVWNSL